MQTRRHGPIQVVQLCLVISICFGWFILASILSVIAGFPVTPVRDASLLGICLFEGLMALAALTVLRFSRFEIRTLIPIPSFGGTLHGAAITLGAIVITWPLYAIFGPNHSAIEQVTQMAAQSRITLPAAVVASLVNGAYEEVFLCGYILRAVEGFGVSIAIGLSMLVRLLYHLYQGPYGALAVVGFGLLASIYFWRTRQLWPVVFAHALADLLALAGAG
jgi:uncharacterized protein